MSFLIFRLSNNILIKKITGAHLKLNQIRPISFNLQNIDLKVIVNKS